MKTSLPDAPYRYPFVPWTNGLCVALLAGKLYSVVSVAPRVMLNIAPALFAPPPDVLELNSYSVVKV